MTSSEGEEEEEEEEGDHHNHGNNAERGGGDWKEDGKRGTGHVPRSPRTALACTSAPALRAFPDFDQPWQIRSLRRESRRRSRPRRRRNMHPC
eukprot:15440955-Alexandrium_andersonii.AAC.1